MDQKEETRRAFFIEGKSIGRIAREGHHDRVRVRKAIHDGAPAHYTLSSPRPRPVLGPFVEFIDNWLDEDRLRTRKRLIAQSHFPYIRTLDRFDFSTIPSVNKAGVIELAKGDYLGKNENVVLIGNIGTGKTHTAFALGIMACQMGKRVRFYTATSLSSELLEAQDQHLLGKKLAQLSRLELLIVDEVSFVPFTPEGARLLFQAFAERYLKGILLITSNL